MGSDQIAAIIVVIMLIISIILICIGFYNIFTVETCKGFVWTLIVGYGLFMVSSFAASSFVSGYTSKVRRY